MPDQPLRYNPIDIAARRADVCDDPMEIAQLLAAWRSPQPPPEQEHAEFVPLDSGPVELERHMAVSAIQGMTRTRIRAVGRVHECTAGCSLPEIVLPAVCLSACADVQTCVDALSFFFA